MRVTARLQSKYTEDGEKAYFMFASPFAEELSGFRLLDLSTELVGQFIAFPEGGLVVGNKYEITKVTPQQVLLFLHAMQAAMTGVIRQGLAGDITITYEREESLV